jgi:hypothetical protein
MKDPILSCLVYVLLSRSVLTDAMRGSVKHRPLLNNSCAMVFDLRVFVVAGQCSVPLVVWTLVSVVRTARIREYAYTVLRLRMRFAPHEAIRTPTVLAPTGICTLLNP